MRSAPGEYHLGSVPTDVTAPNGRDALGGLGKNNSCEKVKDREICFAPSGGAPKLCHLLATCHMVPTIANNETITTSSYLFSSEHVFKGLAKMDCGQIQTQDPQDITRIVSEIGKSPPERRLLSLEKYNTLVQYYINLLLVQDSRTLQRRDVFPLVGSAHLVVLLGVEPALAHVTRAHPLLLVLLELLELLVHEPVILSARSHQLHDATQMEQRTFVHEVEATDKVLELLQAAEIHPIVP